jgi:hypothetical protein
VATDVLNGVRPVRTSLGVDLSDDIWSLMNDCWAHQPPSRPTAAHVTEVMDNICNARNGIAHPLLQSQQHTRRSSLQHLRAVIPWNKHAAKEWLVHEVQTRTNLESAPFGAAWVQPPKPSQAGGENVGNHILIVHSCID